nr:hypothetical protein BaRGS_014671 [Batillaria attramentaria]
MDSISQTFNGLQAAIKRNEERTELAALSISFHAKIRSITYSSQSSLQADKVFLNDDEAFNKMTGIFEAPINGTYIFVANLVPSPFSRRKTRLLAQLAKA